jgi:hypothetical protein
MRLDTKTDWPTGHQSQYNFDLDIKESLDMAMRGVGVGYEMVASLGVSVV